MVERVAREGLPARSIVEAGVWRGGASIYAAAVLRNELEAIDSGASWQVILCDSFKGLPLSSSHEDDDWWWHQNQLRVGKSEVSEVIRAHFPDMPVLEPTEQRPDGHKVVARLVQGFVHDSMPVVQASLPPLGTPEGDIAILRIDLDMYEAYIDTLYGLAERVPPGGFMVMDDYQCVPGTEFAHKLPKDAGLIKLNETSQLLAVLWMSFGRFTA